MCKLDGKIASVTGGLMGIGFATAVQADAANLTDIKKAIQKN